MLLSKKIITKLKKIVNTIINFALTNKLTLFLKKIFKAFTKLPIVRKIVKKYYKLSQRNRRIITVFAYICLALLFSYCFSFLHIGNNTQRTLNGKPILISGTPDFKTILPTGKTIKDFGGWTRISPSTSSPAFVYIDKIGESSINISEQPLPDDLKSDTESRINTLAQDFGAREKVTIGSTIIHIGTSTKGPQSIIFSKNGLLIMIKSTVTISNDKWAAYISNLQ